jgi:hypothetical protein
MAEKTEDRDDSEKRESADEQNSGDGEGRKGSSEEERLIPDEEISDDGQVYVNRDDIDFDPEEGLYSGTAVDGGTDIPGPHEQVDDVAVDEDGEAEGQSEATNENRSARDSNDSDGGDDDSADDKASAEPSEG